MHCVTRRFFLWARLFCHIGREFFSWICCSLQHRSGKQLEVWIRTYRNPGTMVSIIFCGRSSTNILDVLGCVDPLPQAMMVTNNYASMW